MLLFSIVDYAYADVCYSGNKCGANMNITATIINLTKMPFDEAMLYCYDHGIQCPGICDIGSFKDQEYVCNRYFLCCNHVPESFTEQEGFVIQE